MNRIIKMAHENQAKAQKVLTDSGIIKIWKDAGCKVNLVGSLRMGLLAAHRDIDLHVYSKGITTAGSFAVMAKIAELEAVTEIKCINGLTTEECCIAWHILYRAEDGEIWQFDIIHIEESTRYDGYFERMADRINEVITDEQRHTILKLKFETPAEYDFHGVEYYEAVIDAGVTDLDGLSKWVKKRRQASPYYWIP